MYESLLTYFLVAGFLGLLVASILSLFKATFKSAAWFFVLANVLNFFAGVTYFLTATGYTFILVRFNSFFNFSPTLSGLSAIFLTVISLVSALVGVYSVRYLDLYQKTYNKYTTQFLMGLFVFGMQAVLLANNSFTFLFFWEVMSLSSFFLVLSDKTKESFNAAFLYFIMTHLGASAILGGFLILGNGSLFFDLSMIQEVTQQLTPTLATAAFCLFLFGFGSKAGLVPLHVWLPEAHPQAPSNISALMSGLMLKVAIYGFLMVVLNFAYMPTWAGTLVIILGLVSGVVGALYAAIETDMKKAFAYSSIENMGIIFSVIGLAIYITANYAHSNLMRYFIPLIVFAIIHSLSHAFFKTALFLSSGLVISRVHSRSLELMGGFAKSLPLFSFFFLLVIMGSLPIPPFGTFYGEWGLIHVAISLMSQAGGMLLPIVVLILSVIGLIGGLAVFAMIKIFAISMLGLPRYREHEIKSELGDGLLVWPIAGLALGVLSIGIFANYFISIISNVLNSSELITENAIGSISSMQLLSVVLGFLLFAYLLNYFFALNKKERSYHTWDCGQPINSTMEYTAAAFSAPIRFFFLNLIGRNKLITSEPVVVTNPWIRNYSFSLLISSAWKSSVYLPIEKFMNFLSLRVKLIQSGRIQYYLLLLLATLIVALSIAL
ncbi:MAG: proton-conducting transporter membrane subunit [bacterium]